MNKEQQFSQNLVDFLDINPSPYHVVEGGKQLLNNKGFKQLELTETWSLKRGGKYYITRNGSTLVAFIVGTGEPEEHGFKIVGAHTDAPALKIKAIPEMLAEKKYLKLNVEVYGGPIYSTWLDRPLAIAGRVSTKSNNPFKPNITTVDIREPIAIIPNIAIHQNREINNGFKYNPQKDLLPFLGIATDDNLAKDWFITKVAKECNVAKEDILGFDLYLYELQKGMLTGINKELVSVGRLDDVAMSYTALQSIAACEATKSTTIAACFDNEEIGSRTKQGAGSSLMYTLLERIMLGLNKNTEEFHRARYQSFFISCDMAHAVHPNATDKHDATHRPVINGGPVIKVHHGQKYTTDADSGAVFKSVCEKANIPYQEFHNRNDARSGGTIGNIVASLLDVRAVDIGNPMLAMHSIRELGGVLDNYYLYECFKTFFSL